MEITYIIQFRKKISKNILFSLDVSIIFPVQSY